MKFAKKSFSAVALALMFLPVFSYANGAYIPGTVKVSNFSGGASVTGAYNVRHNPGVSLGKIDLYIVNNTIYVSAIDSTNGGGFSCYISSSNPIYAAAEKAAYGAGNGAAIFASRSTNSAVCNSLTYRNASDMLD